MRENIQQIVFMAQHDPAAIAGFLLLVCASVLFFHVQLKMIRAGYKTSYSFFGKPFGANGWDSFGTYLKLRTQHGWSPWLVYLLGPTIILGVGLLLFGLFQLQK